MNKIFYLLLFLSVNLYSQTKIYPYRDFEFDNFTPKWIYTSYDSTIIDTSMFFDGYNHLHLTLRSEEPLSFISNNYLYNVSISSALEGITGSFIEKIDITNGSSVWMNRFDLTNNDRIEHPFKAFLNEENQLEIINLRVIKDARPFFYSFAGGIVHTAIRKINTNTGNEESHIYSPDEDTTFHEIIETPKLPNAMKKNDTNKYVHTYLSYGFLNEKSGWDIEKKYYVSILMDSLGITKDTLYRIDIEFPDRANEKFILGGIRHLNSDSTIMLAGSYFSDSAKESLLSSLIMVDNEGNILREFELNDAILPLIQNDTKVFYHFVYSDNDYFVISSDVENKRYFFVFDLSKSKPVYSFELEKENVNINSGYYPPVFLRLNDANFLIAAAKYNTENGKKKISLDFLQTNDGNLKTIKSFTFTKPNDILRPTRMYQLDNSDILFTGLHSVDSSYVLEDQPRHEFFGSWLKTIYFTKDDLNYTTSTKDISDASKVKIYPNPTSGKLHLAFEKSITGKIEIFNLLGELVMNKDISNLKHINLDVSQFTSGLYFVNVIREDGTYFSESFVKE